MLISKNRLFAKPGLFSKTRLWGILLGITVGVLLSLARTAGLFNTWQLSSTDFLHGDTPPGGEIIIVAIDDASIAQLGSWPWDHAAHAQLLDILTPARVVCADILFEESDDSLAEATKRASNVVYPVFGVLPGKAAPGVIPAQSLIEPSSDLCAAAAGLGTANIIPDPDNVIRRVPLLIRRGNRLMEAMGLQTLRHYLGLPHGPPGELEDGYVRAGPLLIPTDQWGRMTINFVGEPGTFPTVSYANVLAGDIPPAVFRDKIVLVGQVGVTGGGDIHIVPTSRGGREMSGVEIQANIIHTMLKHRFLRGQPLANDVAVILGIAVFSGLVLSHLRLLWGLLAALLLGGGYWLYVFSAFDRGQILDLLYPTFSLGLSYTAVTVGEFVLEKQRRRRVTELFGRYVPPAIVDEILVSPEAMKLDAAREQEITVIFTDIRNFTTFSEKTPPRQVVEILNSYLNEMTEAVFAHRGTVDKFTGDGLMALFNAPVHQSDHALQAVRAALMMQENARKLDDTVGEPLRYGIGIHTGRAIVGNIGSQQRLEYTAIGDTVNLSARLQGIAQGGQTLISQATYERVKEWVQVQEIGPIKVKGRQEPVLVYRVMDCV